jgi:hypothetical protein
MTIESGEQPKNTRRRSPEMRLQAKCFIRAWNEFPITRRLLFHVANELDMSGDNAIKGAIRRSEGIIKGVSDLILLIPRGCYHGLMIEMKWGDNTQSKHQKEWQALVESQGYRYEVIYTEDDFVALLAEYLAEK